MAGATATASDDRKSVTLTIPGSALAGGEAAGAGVTGIAISGLMDIAGNTLEPVTAFVRKAAVLTAVSYAAVDVNKLQVTFSNPLKTVDPAEFKLYKSDGFTPVSAGTAYVLDATGRIATITMNASLLATAKAADAEATTAKLAVGTLVTKDIYGNAVSGAVAVPAVSQTTPATVTIADKIAPSVVSVSKGTAEYVLEVNFTEPVNAFDLTTLASAVRIKNLSGTVQTATYSFSGGSGTITDFTKLTATITGGTESQYSVELLAQGIADLAGNTLKAFAKTTVTLASVDSLAIVSAETQDLDKNGRLDAVKLTFNRNISDSTVNANSFDIAGYSFETFNAGTAGDAANNNVIYITFPEAAAADTGATPTITYTQGTLADTNGVKLASTGALATVDKAAPAVITALPVGTLTAGGTPSSATLTLSEALTADSQQAVLTAIQAQITKHDLVITDDIAVSYTWTAGSALTVSITGNANGGSNPDNIVLAAATADLIDTAGNTAAAVQVVK
jgi:hypothetical protein